LTWLDAKSGLQSNDASLEENMSDDLLIRAAEDGDAPVLAQLLDQLGYPALPQAVQARLTRLAGDPRAQVFLAELAGRVCGLATVHAHDSLNRDDPAVQLTLLVVADHVRGSGVGRRLVGAAESWAIGQGARRLVVTTAVHRAGAHVFYEKLGYQLTGRRYARDLSP
jgi:GNAT superfamily N-acetyltransferase